MGAMIAGYTWSGNGRLAGKCLQDMQQNGLKPGDVIYTNILAACSHAGLLKEGSKLFSCVREKESIASVIEHYSCMIDLLGRAGWLKEAEDVLYTMPIQPDIIAWTSLLTSCKTYGNVEVGKKCFDEVIRLDPTAASGYVLMSNIYSDIHMGNNVDKIQDGTVSAFAQKKPGVAWIEINQTYHEFVVGGNGCLDSCEIHEKIKSSSRLIRVDGYVPQLGLILAPVVGEDNEGTYCEHLKKLAG